MTRWKRLNRTYGDPDPGVLVSQRLSAWKNGIVFRLVKLIGKKPVGSARASARRKAG